MPSLFSFRTLFFFLSALSLQAKFIHPGIIHSQQGIDFVKSKIAAKEDPWLSAWEQLQESSYADLSWKATPVPHVERGPYNDPDIGSSDFSSDSRAAYTHALHWTLSGDQKHAQKASEIIHAWSTTLKSITNHDARLLIGMSGQNYLVAAELLNHHQGGWEGWSKKKESQFEKMLRQIWYPVIQDFHPTANGNWDASMLQTMIAMGVFLDDQAMFDRATNYYLEGQGNGAIGMYFKENGQCQESGRDQNHTQMGLEFLSNTAETAWVQNLDLYKALDNRLLAGFEYTAKYNLGHDVPYQAYKSFEDRYYYKKISSRGRGRLRNMYEKVFNHYSYRQQLKAPFIKKATAKIRLKISRRGPLLWDTLMFYQQPFPRSVK